MKRLVIIALAVAAVVGFADFCVDAYKEKVISDNWKEFTEAQIEEGNDVVLGEVNGETLALVMYDDMTGSNYDYEEVVAYLRAN